MNRSNGALFQAANRSGRNLPRLRLDGGYRSFWNRWKPMMSLLGPPSLEFSLIEQEEDEVLVEMTSSPPAETVSLNYVSIVTHGKRNFYFFDDDVADWGRRWSLIFELFLLLVVVLVVLRSEDSSNPKLAFPSPLELSPRYAICVMPLSSVFWYVWSFDCFLWFLIFWYRFFSRFFDRSLLVSQKRRSSWKVPSFALGGDGSWLRGCPSRSITKKVSYWPVKLRRSKSSTHF